MAEFYGFYGDGISFRVSLANHSDSESFLVVLPLFSQDGCQREGFWEMVRHVVSPLDLSWTLPCGGGLLVLCSLPGPPVIKQLMQTVTYGAWPGWAVSVTVLPLAVPMTVQFSESFESCFGFLGLSTAHGSPSYWSCLYCLRGERSFPGAGCWLSLVGEWV